MSVVDLPVRTLSRAEFAPFGEVIEWGDAKHFDINDGFATRYHDLASIDVQQEGGRPLLSMFRAKARELPLRIEMMERHPLGSQAFIPCDDWQWLIVVAVADSTGAPMEPVVFEPLGREGINIARGVWHYPLISFESGEYWVIDRGGEGDNLEEHH